MRRQALEELVDPRGHPVLDPAYPVLRLGWQCLNTVVGKDRVDKPAGAADVGPRQVDLAGHAPGAVGGPPQVRALPERCLRGRGDAADLCQNREPLLPRPAELCREQEQRPQPPQNPGRHTAAGSESLGVLP
jgi:hypothetical protein